MAGINLSQSIQERQAAAQVRFFDRGLIGGLIMLGVLMLVAGGVYWYANRLTQEMTVLDAMVAEKSAALTGSRIDRVVDFDDRVQHIQKHAKTESDPTSFFRLVEENTLPTIRLTLLRFDRGQSKLFLAGEARTLKEVAQQMLVVKQLQDVSEVQVERITYSESGFIDFSLMLRYRAGEMTMTP